MSTFVLALMAGPLLAAEIPDARQLVKAAMEYKFLF